jgi:hypothetical protein
MKRFNLFKNTGLNSKKLLIIGIICIFVIGVFILVNYVEYNVNNLIQTNTKQINTSSNNINSNTNRNTINSNITSNNSSYGRMIESFSSNGVITSVLFNNELTPSLRDPMPEIHYEGLNEDIIINRIDYTSPEAIKMNIDVKIINTDNLQLIRNFTILKDEFKLNPQTDDAFNYTITKTIPLSLSFNSKYAIVFIHDKVNELNNSMYMFSVGDGRFRFNSLLLKDTTDTNNPIELDTLELKLYNSNTISNIPNDKNIDLQQFNKVNFVIVKPNFNEMQQAVAKTIINTNPSMLTNIMNEFNKFIPMNIDVRITDLTSDNSFIKPDYKLPNTLSFCESDKAKTVDFNKKGCILEIYNVLPEHKYELKIKLIYKHSNNFRESKEYSITFSISTTETSKTNDLLSTSILANKNLDFTKDFIQILEKSGDFKAYQNLQNKSLATIEKNMNKLMNQYNL